MCNGPRDAFQPATKCTSTNTETCNAEVYLRACEGDLDFGDSGAAVVACGVGSDSDFAAACVGIVVGGHKSRPGFWLLPSSTMLEVLDTIRHLPGMSLGKPDAQLAQAAEEQYGLRCMPLPEEQQIQLDPYRSPEPDRMDQKIKRFTDVMISEFDCTTIPKHQSGSTENILHVGKRSAVVEAAEAYSHLPKVQDLIKNTARFDHAASGGAAAFLADLTCHSKEDIGMFC